MRILFLFVCFVLINLQTSAQPTTLSLALKQLAMDESKGSKPVSILIRGEAPSVREAVTAAGGIIKFEAGDIVSATVPAGSLNNLSKNPAIIRMEEGRLKLRELNDRMLVNNRIDLVHQGVSPLLSGYDGSGVIVGIIDTGIDFTHPDFKDSLGNSRILWIWDHILPNAGNTPALYNYGQEFSKTDIENGLATAHVDQTAHGTHVAGIATASGDTMPEFKGAAPKSDIIAVSLDFNLNDDEWLSSIADAVAYIFNKADSLGQPCVINISAGTYFGSHDGLDLSAQAIDNLIAAQNGRMVVAAAGNAGNYALHFRHALNNDTALTWFTPSGSNPIYIEAWSDTADIAQLEFSVAADQLATQPLTIGSLPWRDIQYHLGILRTDTLFSVSGNRIATVLSYGQLVGGRIGLIYQIQPDSTNCIFRLTSKGNGLLDGWSFESTVLTPPPSSIFPMSAYHRAPDLQQNICSSFQCSDKVICVGQYVNRNNYIDYNGATQTFPTIEGALAVSSSRGPTRDGRTKPDITATGEITLSALKLSMAPWFIANQPFKLAQGGMHIRNGGTSSAAPAVAGAIALYLQQNPNATWTDIRNRVLLCSRNDQFTGANLPNNLWGHGKLDAFSLSTGCLPLSLPENSAAALTIYPNPTTSLVKCSFPEEITDNAECRVFDSFGRLICQFTISPSSEFTIDTGAWPAGVYRLLVLEERKDIRSGTLMVVR